MTVIQLHRLRKRAAKETVALVASSGLGSAVDRAVFRSVRPPAPHEEPADDALSDPAAASAALLHVLIAPPGGGNIGDQAMVEAFLENTTGPVCIVVRSVSDIRLPPAHADRAELRPIPALIYGSGRAHREAIVDLRTLLYSARSVTVVGADIMDGAYSVRASIRRADVAALAAEAGVDTRILGFSWNGRARRGARRALARAGKSGAQLLLRDPLSARRAREDGLRNVVEVADSVFAARTSVDAWSGHSSPAHPSPGRPYAVVNASAYVGRSMDQSREYARIVDWMLGAGLTVYLLPHVVRSSADDAVACAAVRDLVDDPRVVLIDRLLAPAEVRGLCASAEFILTGRMHLAVQALWSTVPSVTLSTQGKVEGMMQLFELEELCVEPGAALAERMIPLLGRLVHHRAHYSARIAERLPHVRRLSHLNFAALT